MKQFILLFTCLFSFYQSLITSDNPTIGIYWGSFDPPTLAHRQIILTAMEEKKLEKIVVFVNQFGNKPYHTEAKDRKKMVELMFEDQLHSISVVIQSNPDKRIDFRNSREAGYRLSLIVGEDSYFKRLALPLEQQGPVDIIFVIPRSYNDTKLETSLEQNDEILYVKDIENISSTTIRQQLQSGYLGHTQLHQQVLKYICERDLYAIHPLIKNQNLEDRESNQYDNLLKQHTSDLSELLENAKETQSRLSDFLNAFAGNYQNARLYIPSIKGMQTIQNLLDTRWNGDASMITDYSRATISFPTVDMMYKGLEDLKTSGLTIIQVTDSFKTPYLGGYRDINVVFRDMVNGHLGEIQLNIHSIMEFKNGLGTDLFHVIRYFLSIPLLEQRALTRDEQSCLDMLFEKEHLGYEEALKLG